MAKKKRIWAYTGSMIKPLARYFKKIKVVVNPHDIKGSSIGETILMQTFQTKQKYLQPNIEILHSIEKDLTVKHAKMDIEFINGWELKYNLLDCQQQIIMEQIQEYNTLIENKRNEQDFDDEPADEDSQL